MESYPEGAATTKVDVAPFTVRVLVAVATGPTRVIVVVVCTVLVQSLALSSAGLAKTAVARAAQVKEVTRIV